MFAKCVFQRCSKQLPLQSMRPNVLVVKSRGIHKAPDNQPGSAHFILQLTSLVKQLTNRFPRGIRHNLPEFSCNDHCFACRKLQRCVIRLLRLRNLRIREEYSSALNQSWRGRGTSQHNRHRPTRFDSKSEARRNRLAGFHQDPLFNIQAKQKKRHQRCAFPVIASAKPDSAGLPVHRKTRCRIGASAVRIGVAAESAECLPRSESGPHSFEIRRFLLRRGTTQ